MDSLITEEADATLISLAAAIPPVQDSAKAI